MKVNMVRAAHVDSCVVEWAQAPLDTRVWHDGKMRLIKNMEKITKIDEQIFKNNYETISEN